MMTGGQSLGVTTFAGKAVLVSFTSGVLIGVLRRIRAEAVRLRLLLVLNPNFGVGLAARWRAEGRSIGPLWTGSRLPAWLLRLKKMQVPPQLSLVLDR